MRRFTLLAAALSVLAVTAPALSATDMTTPPVIKQRATGFGSVLARTDHQVLYYWNVEKRDFKVHCTGVLRKGLAAPDRAHAPRRAAAHRRASPAPSAPSVARTAGSR